MSATGDLPHDLATSEFQLGDFIVHPELKTLRKARGEVEDGTRAVEKRLPDKAMDVLVHLASNARRVCARDEILDAVWGPDRAAYDRVLDNAVRDIRRALEDDARDPVYIQTIPKKGYRLLAPVEVAQVPVRPAESRKAAPRLQQEPRAKGRTLPKVLLVLLTIAGIGAYGFLHRSRSTLAVQITIADDVPRELAESLHQRLFGTPECGEDSAFVPARAWLPVDLTVGLVHRSESGSQEGPALRAFIRPQNGAERAVLHDVPEGSADGASDRFVAEVLANLDQVACSTPSLPRSRRACHCIASTDIYEAYEEPGRYIQSLRKAIELDPGRIHAYERLASIYQDIGDIDSKLSTLRQGLEHLEDPDSDQALTLRRQLAQALGDHIEVGRLTDELTVRHPDDARWTIAKARFEAVERRNCARALELIEPVLKQDVVPAEALTESARAHWMCSQYEKAVNLLRRRVESAPSDVNSRLWLAPMLSYVGRWEEARETANEALALAPDFGSAYWALGIVSEAQGHYAKAESWLRRSLGKVTWPHEEARAKAGLARIAEARGDHEACLALTEGLPEPSRDQEYNSPTWQRGLCLTALGRIDEASTLMEELARRRNSSGLPIDEYLLHLRGRIELAKARTPSEQRRAVESLVAAADLPPARPLYFRWQAGHAALRIGDLELARMQFDQALQINPNDPFTLSDYGLLDLRQGRVDEAIDHMRRSIDVFGNPPEDPLGMVCAEALAELDPSFEVARR